MLRRRRQKVISRPKGRVRGKTFSGIIFGANQTRQKLQYCMGKVQTSMPNELGVINDLMPNSPAQQKIFPIKFEHGFAVRRGIALLTFHTNVSTLSIFIELNQLLARLFPTNLVSKFIYLVYLVLNSIFQVVQLPQGLVVTSLLLSVGNRKRRSGVQCSHARAAEKVFGLISMSLLGT